MIAALLVIVVALFLLYSNGSFGGTISCCSSCCDCGGSVVAGNITSNPLTWPSGDRIWLVCHAIALAEGANISGSVPDNANNPGDISDGFNTYGGTNVDGSNVTQFPDKNTGWQWLYNKISAIVNGTSHSYSATESWNSFGQKWSGDWKTWVTNVTGTLGVSPTSSLQDYLNS
jgi:hypothetical protein